jgi:hypothetical protein
VELYLYRPPPIFLDGMDRDRFTFTFCLFFDTLSLHHFVVQFLLSSNKTFEYKAVRWTLLSSSPSSGHWDRRWNQQTPGLQTEFNPITADYRSSVRCSFTHSWYLCKKLIFEVLEKGSELFCFNTFHLLFKYVRV